MTALVAGCDAAARSAAPTPQDARVAAVDPGSVAPHPPPAPAPAPAPPPAAPMNRTPPETPTERRTFVAAGSNALAFDIYASVAGAGTHDANVALSPLSITTALAMAVMGARGETSVEMLRTLHLEGGDDALIAAVGGLAGGYGHGPVTLRVANRLFVEGSYPILHTYAAQASATFHASPAAVDFRGASDAARLTINAWASRETQDRVKDLIPAGGVTGDTRLVLASAVYFKGDWATPFEPNSTSPELFFTSVDARSAVPTMHRQGTYRFAAVDGVKVIDVPYTSAPAPGHSLVMTLVLPDATDGVAALEARLTPESYDRWIAAETPEKVRVALPRVDLAPREPLRLGAVLRALGMTRAFDPLVADFTGIASPPSPADRIMLEEVFHKALVKIDEKGTEASAATAVAMAHAAARLPRGDEPPKDFRADHPFLFFLRDTTTKAILFMGRVSDPR